VNLPVASDMPILRQAPGLDKIVSPIAKLLSRSEDSRISTHAIRMATNMVIRWMGGMNSAVSSEQEPEYMWDIASTPAFSTSEPISELTLNPFLDVFVRNAQSSLNDALQNLLTGREVTKATILNGFVRDFCYALDDAGRVTGYMAVKPEIDPWIKAVDKPIETRSIEVINVLRRAVDTNKLAAEDIPTILRLVGTAGNLYALDPKLGQAALEPQSVRSRKRK